MENANIFKSLVLIYYVIESLVLIYLTSMHSVLVNLAQLVWTTHNIYKVQVQTPTTTEKNANE
jgi:hypothetical protein